jgi:predicted 3-demethylubiquinone-9 3-methyltransferase (glyoxalase superfamily)
MSGAAQKVTVSLWFGDCAEEAAQFYVATFGDGRIVNVSRHGGKVMAVTFELFGQTYLALNGAESVFTPALSLLVSCETQDEIDRYWGPLAEGGKPMRFGWIADRFGLTWQIVPAQLKSLLGGEQAGRVMAAACQMQKIDLAALIHAAKG